MDVAPDDRWRRLERYARFRGYMHLEHLPHDVLEHLVEHHLDQCDVMRLADAFVRRRVEWDDAAGLSMIPPWLRGRWTRVCGSRRMTHLIHCVTDECMWFASTFCGVSLHIDWSPYDTCKQPCPVARFEWSMARPHASIHLDTAEAERRVLCAMQRGSRCICVGIYMDNGITEPLYVRSFPYTLLPPPAQAQAHGATPDLPRLCCRDTQGGAPPRLFRSPRQIH